jgi:hypothetical protein
LQKFRNSGRCGRKYREIFATQEGATMKDTRKQNEKIIKEFNGRNDSLLSEESVFTSATVLHPRFKEHSRPIDAHKAPTHDQIAKRAYGLWQEKGSLSNQEEACWLKAEIELRHEV